MKRKWSLRLGAAVLCAVLLGSCGSTAAAPAESTAPADPLTGQQLLYPEQRAAAVVILSTLTLTTFQAEAKIYRRRYSMNQQELNLPSSTSTPNPIPSEATIQTSWPRRKTVPTSSSRSRARI